MINLNFYFNDKGQTEHSIDFIDESLDLCIVFYDKKSNIICTSHVENYNGGNVNIYFNNDFFTYDGEKKVINKTGRKLNK